MGTPTEIKIRPPQQKVIPAIKSESQRRKLQAMLDAAKDEKLPENYSRPKPYHFGKD